ncbi:hypothetical protein ACHAXS_005145 [Conticribra weissflogii]
MAPSPFLPCPPPPATATTTATSSATQTTTTGSSDEDENFNATNSNVHSAVKHSETSPPRTITPAAANASTTESSEYDDLISQAVRAHDRIFQTHVQTILHHTSSQYLLRKLTKRLRSHLEENFTTEELMSRHHSDGVRRVSATKQGASNAIDDSEEALALLASKPLEVQREDVDEAYALAVRVGEKWAEVLFREGYEELADVVRGVVGRGDFLECFSQENHGGGGGTLTEGEGKDVEGGLEDQLEGGNHQQGEESNVGDFILPYSKLNSLRRYPPDCDGSGTPLPFLPVHDWETASSSSANDQQTSSQTSSTRKVIQKLDSLARKGETMWNYGWDVILEALKRSKRRKLRSHGAKNLSDTIWEEEYPSVGLPFFDAEDEDRDSEEGGRSLESVEENFDDYNSHQGQPKKKKRRKNNLTSRKSVTFQIDTNECDNNDEKNNWDIVKDDFLTSTQEVKAEKISQHEKEMMQISLNNNKGNQHKVNDFDNHVDEADDLWEVPQERGRPPSTLEWEQWTLDDVQNCMTKEERMELIRLAVHPPYPFENDSNDDTYVDASHTESIRDGKEAVVNNTENSTIGDPDEAITNLDTKPSPDHANNKLCKQTTVKKVVADEQEQPPEAIICGALKPLGSIHLWEQTRHLSEESSHVKVAHYENNDTTTMPTHEEARASSQADETIYGAAEALSEHEAEQLRRRKASALRKATKERIGYRVPKLPEDKAENGYGVSSKVVWTRGSAHEQKHGSGSGVGGSSSRCSAFSKGSGRPDHFLGEEEKQMWLELDLGECVVETTLDNVHDNDYDNSGNDANYNKKGPGKKRKRMMAFRSLEIALKNWP